jgi:hypothetical protein
MLSSIIQFLVYEVYMYRQSFLFVIFVTPTRLCSSSLPVDYIVYSTSRTGDFLHIRVKINAVEDAHGMTMNDNESRIGSWSINRLYIAAFTNEYILMRKKSTRECLTLRKSHITPDFIHGNRFSNLAMFTLFRCSLRELLMFSEFK